MEKNIEKNISIKDISFEQAKLTDIDQILEFDSLNTPPLFDKSKLEEEISNDSNYCIVARYMDKAVGYGSLSIMYDHADILYILASKYFGRIGIASNILNILIHKCKELGLEDIFLEVRESNTPAITLYTKHNFEKVSIRSKYYTHPIENAIILKRSI